MPRTKSKNSMFQKELEIVNKTRKIQNKPGLAREELQEEYRFLSEKYNKLLKEMMKITRIGDMHYKKLMEANEEIQKHKNILEELTQQLLEANIARDKFYSIIAHDLRNPLQVLLFSSELMTSEYEEIDEKSTMEFVEKVNKTVQNMVHLLENLLQWGKTQFDEIECRPETIDLYPLAQENIEYLYGNAEKKNISLSLKIPENTWVFADENMIKTVLRNLISNAIKFTWPGGKVILSCKEEDDFIVTAIQDTGVGIPGDKIDLLFKLGEHYSTPGTAKEKGSSLGLLICKEFIQKNGGEIRVKSKPNKGSTFEFTLPKSPPQNTI